MSNPEIVEVYVEGEDRATPSLTSVSRSLVLLGANILRVGAFFGMESKEAEKAIQTLMMIGHVGRAVAAAKNLLGVMTWFAASAETAHASATGLSTTALAAKAIAAGGAQAVLTTYTGATVGATAANYGLAMSFKMLMLSMGPIGWALLGVTALLGVLGGYALAGGFGGGAAKPRAEARAFGMGEGAKYQEMKTEITVNVDNLSTQRDIKKTIEDVGTLYWEETRKHRSVG